MEVIVEFKEVANPCTTKPKGCGWVKHEDIYVALDMFWMVTVSDKRVVDGEGETSVMFGNFYAKPTRKQINKLKKLVWK